MTFRIAGCDPGVNGGWALAEKDKVQMVEIMPAQTEEIIALLKQWEVTHVYIEKPKSMPGNRGQAMLNYGIGFGIILGVCRTLKIPVRMVHPPEWVKEICRGTKKEGTTAKERSLEAALNLFPWINFKATPRCKKYHDGLYESACIAEYGRREQLGVLKHG
jgi:crossover junction endodeoxyribonuclease RuvC